MQRSDGPPGDEDLRGSVEETALWQVVTMNGVNRFSGAVEVQAGSRSGTLFFDDGRLVHAEAGGRTGEEAFHRIMRWSGASYRIESDAVPSQVSITKGLAPLLVDLKGLPVAEMTPPPSPVPAPAGPRLDWLVATAERIGRIPGVLRAMLHGKDGPVGDLDARRPEERQALLLGRAGRRLGDAFGLGRLVLGVGRGSERLVLVLTTREHQLTVLLRADDGAEAAQAEIRNLLHPKT